jgi:hypothetical protein
LARESFGNRIDVAYHEYCEWQYLKNPIGKRYVIIAYNGEKAIGQIASIPCLYKIGKEFAIA